MITTRMQLLAGILLCLPLAAAVAQGVHAVPSLDLNRYTGTWFEIARFPNRFQSSCAGNVSAHYQRRSDGSITVVNACRKSDGSQTQVTGEARLPDPSHPAQLEVRFAPAWLSWLPFVWGRYWVLDLSPDYAIAAVGEPERAYLWILARTPTLSEPVYQAVLQRVKAQGFDTAKLVRTPQG